MNETAILYKVIFFGMIIAAIGGCTFVDQNADIATVANDADTKAYSTVGYTLKWSDEFDAGTVPDAAKWAYDTGGGGWGNNELQYYTDRSANAYIANGTLVIKSIKESYEGYSYTSARIKTQGKYSFRYGKIVARIMLSGGIRTGLWPAFWMLGESITSVGWPACGEIDIMENVGTSSVYATCHWSNAGAYASYGLSTITTINSYHDYEVEWDPAYIRARVDGVEFFAIDITPAELSEFQNAFFIILNQAVGGNWPGKPSRTTVFPAYMYVDYVRVYQK